MTGLVELSFGRGQLAVALPPDASPVVIRKRTLAPLADPGGAIRHAFENPVGGRPLAAAARGAGRASILVCDITRPVPNHLFLRPMIETIAAAGVALEAITVLVATGLHRPNEGDELAALIGDDWVLDHVRVENHHARDDLAHVDLGRTARGTPIRIDRRFVEADLRIATGLVEPHFMAGWSGGRKVVAPGVAGHETIRTFHSARFMEDPAAREGNLEGNPLHEEQTEIVGRIGAILGLNTVLDDQRRLAHVTFGEVLESHRAAVEFVAAATRVPVGRRFGTVLTSSAGYPLDRTYYQTVKGMVTPLDILAPGGTLIMASECGEGFGSAEFRAAQTRLASLGPDRFLASITGKALADIDEWQTEKQVQSMRHGRVELYAPGLDAEERRITCLPIVADLTEAVRRSIARTGDPAVAVIPEGPYVLPVRAAA